MQQIVESVSLRTIKPRNAISSQKTKPRSLRASTTPTLNSCLLVQDVQTTDQVEKELETETGLSRQYIPETKSVLVGSEKLFASAATRSQEPKI